MQKEKKSSPFFKKIPKTALLTPGGMICLFVALIIEFLDYLFDIFGYFLFGGASEVISGPIKTIIDLFYAFLSAFLLGIPLWSNLLPFLIERIPLVGTILPTWVIRLFI